MTGPFSDHELESLDVIELQLIESQVSSARMKSACASFLLFIISREWSKRFLDSDGIELLLNENLKLVAFNFYAIDSGEEIKNARIKLFGIFDHLQREDPSQAALIRCAIFCLHDEEWDPDTQEDPTPIPFYLFLLKKFDLSIGMDFLAHVRTHLLCPC